MATILLPDWLRVASFEWGIQKNAQAWASPHNGTMQARVSIGERWVVGIRHTPELRKNSGRLEALFSQLAGGVDRLRMHHIGRPTPKGTMRGSPVLAAQATRGATSLTLTVASGATLSAGDMIGAASHLFQVAADCTASGTTLVVPLVNRPRSTIAAGTAVVWDKPTADFVMPSASAMFAHVPGSLEGGAFDLVEVF